MHEIPHKEFPQESYQDNNKQLALLVIDLNDFLLDTRDTVKVFESLFFTLVTLGFKGIMLIACWKKEGSVEREQHISMYYTLLHILIYVSTFYLHVF